MKKLFIVSTGRCGTTRISQILKNKFSKDDFNVIHQVKFSRIANIIGNIMYYLGQNELIKKYLLKLTLNKYNKKNLITSDPLIAMIIPKTLIESNKVCIVLVTREPKSFASSFKRMTRQKLASFIAHNFIPFWQLGIWPLENLLNKNIDKKYEKIQIIKSKYFRNQYTLNPNFIEITMKEMFSENIIEDIINKFFNTEITISKQELNTKANATRK